MGTLTERLALVIEANAGQAIAQFKTLGAASKSLSGDVGHAQGALQNIAGRVGTLGGLGIGSALAAEGTAIVGMVTTSIGAFQSLAGEVRQVRNVMGGTATDASYMVAAFTAAGVPVDTLTTGLFQLEKHLGASGDGLAQYGVQTVRDAAGNVNMAKTLLSVVDAYSKMSDPIQRATFLQAALGKGAVALLPLLAKGPQWIREIYAEAERHHLILDDQDLVRAAQLNAALRDMHESIKGIEVEAGRALVPAATTAVTLLDKGLARVDDLLNGPGLGSSGGGFWGNFTQGTHALVGGLGDLLSLIPGVNSALATTGATGVVTAADLTAVGNAIAGQVDADRALAASQRSLAADQRSLAGDTKTYDELLATGAVDAKKVAAAQQSLAAAIRSVGHAQRQQADAQTAYNEAAAAFDILGTDTAGKKKHDAANALADANDNVTSALEAQTTAAAALARERAGDPDYQTKLAAAKQRVADDTQNIADAEYNVGQKTLAAVGAHNAEAQAIAGKADVVERLIGDYKTLIGMTPALGPFLNPQLGVLGPPGAAPPSSAPKAPPAIPGTPGGPPLLTQPQPGKYGAASYTPSGAPAVVNIAMTTIDPDPVQVAKTIVWHLS